jgi:hypothetical protein
VEERHPTLERSQDKIMMYQMKPYCNTYKFQTIFQHHKWKGNKEKTHTMQMTGLDMMYLTSFG